MISSSRPLSSSVLPPQTQQTIVSSLVTIGLLQTHYQKTLEELVWLSALIGNLSESQKNPVNPEISQNPQNSCKEKEGYLYAELGFRERPLNFTDPTGHMMMNRTMANISDSLEKLRQKKEDRWWSSYDKSSTTPSSSPASIQEQLNVTLNTPVPTRTQQAISSFQSSSYANQNPALYAVGDFMYGDMFNGLSDIMKSRGDGWDYLALGSIIPIGKALMMLKAASKSTDFVLGIGSVIRKVNIKRGAEIGWGLTPAHLKKHLFGNGKDSLSTIDPAGNADIWAQNLSQLFSSPVTGKTGNGMLDIISQFPKADGSGMYNMGIRLAPKADGTFDLITVLTRQ